MADFWNSGRQSYKILQIHDLPDMTTESVVIRQHPESAAQDGVQARFVLAAGTGVAGCVFH